MAQIFWPKLRKGGIIAMIVNCVLYTPSAQGGRRESAVHASENFVRERRIATIIRRNAIERYASSVAMPWSL